MSFELLRLVFLFPPYVCLAAYMDAAAVSCVGGDPLWRSRFDGGGGDHCGDPLCVLGGDPS